MNDRGKRKRVRVGPPLQWALPAAALTFAVHFLSVGSGAIYAFTNWNGTSPRAKWIGLENFREFWATESVRGALANSLGLALLAVVLSNCIGLALALGLNRTLRTRNFLRAVFFLPVVLSPLAVSYVWQYIFDPFGPLNESLGSVGMASFSRAWLAERYWAQAAILVVMVWQYSGLAMAFYLAGLQGIPDEIEEAAAVDGASTLQRFRHIVLPLLAPAMTVSITLITIWSLRVFDQVLALTGGGPAEASETLATQVFKQTFVAGRFGFGAALALVLTLLVMVVSVLQLIILRRSEKRMK
jgi:raffinose/stachyose/melibiose transport system permease protein